MPNPIATLTVLGLIVAFASADPQTSSRALPLFDGTTFTGWQGDTERTWRIEDGALVGGSLTETVPRNDFLVTTRAYGDFVLRLEYKLEGSEGMINAGVQFRSQRLAKPAHEMIGYQADMGTGYWGALYDESRRRRVLAGPDQKAILAHLRLEDWNRYEVHAEGGRIRLVLNGEQTVDYLEPDDTIPRSGFIGLQVHGGGKALVRYRNITIQELR